MSTAGAASPSMPHGPAARSTEQHLSRRRTPYTILASIQLIAAGLCGVFAIPGIAQQIEPVVYAQVAAALLVAAAVTWWVLPLIPRDLGIDVGLVMGYLLAAGATLVTPTGEGQVLIGLGLTSYAVFAAYFLPRRRLQVSLVLLFVIYGVSERLNEQMSSPAVYWMVVAVITGLASLVSQLVERLRDLALHDGLTGLYNRRGLDLLAPQLLSACARSRTPVTVGLVDLDQFKSYNDTHGHLAGDELLQHVSRSWQGQLRDSDLAARFGGDEFALVLVDARQPDAGALEARVRTVSPAAGGLESPGWTVGWAEVAPGETLYDALGRADVALFEAKRGRGANRA